MSIRSSISASTRSQAGTGQIDHRDVGLGLRQNKGNEQEEGEGEKPHDYQWNNLLRTGIMDMGA